MLAVRTEAGERSLSLDELEDEIRKGELEACAEIRFPVLTGDRWVQAQELELFRSLYTPVRIHFTRSFRLGGVPVMTVALILAQVLLFFGLGGGQVRIPLETLIASGAKVPASIVELGETWRLLTANFLHRDLAHLAFNMLFLFSLGGTMEIAYRRQDFALILLSAALGTTLMSLAMSSQVSFGASGLVLGFFGAAIAFGLKYAKILPRKYRRYIRGVTIPYAVFILCLGLLAPDTDNWGHLGGLLGGLMAATTLEPKLLHVGRQRPLLRRHAATITLLCGLAIVLLGGQVTRHVDSPVQEFGDPHTGLHIAYPAAWSSTKNHLGYPTWGNALGAGVGFSVRISEAGPLSLMELRRRFLRDHLGPQEQSGAVTQVKIEGERPFQIAGGRALELAVRLRSRAGVQHTRNLLIERGYYGYVVVLSAPEHLFEDYSAIFDDIQTSIWLEEPAALRSARDAVSVFPGMSSALVTLGDNLAAVRNVDGARAAFELALESLPDDAAARYGLVRLAADYGGDLEEAETWARRLLQENRERPEAVALLAKLRMRLGQPDSARALVRAGLESNPEAASLRALLRRLAPPGS